ncbi:MAG: Type 1 glutamine amidotransferase-like domain-containing protein, partial [Caldilineaceae bacterium]
YSLNAAAGNSLDAAAVDLWSGEQVDGVAQRGLSFGMPGLITDQHFFQRGRIARLINAITLPGAPSIGLGVDAYTGAIVRGDQVGDLFGLYVAAVFDAASYGAAANATRHGEGETLSARNVLVHLLAPGAFSYNLTTRAHSLAPLPTSIARNADGLRLPSGAGTLILAGDLSKSLDGHPALDLLRAEATAEAGTDGRLFVVAAGYPAARTAQSAADRYAAAIGLPATTLGLGADDTAPIAVPDGTTASLLLGRDQALMHPEQFAALRDAWLAGVPMLLDNAAAAIAGPVYSAHEPTPEEGEEAEAATQKSMLARRTTLADGLALLDASVEPQLLENNRWGRLFSLAYKQPDLPALGISRAGAVAITSERATVLGDAPLVVIDFSNATLAMGANEGFVVANGLIDVFAPGETIAPTPASLVSPILPAPQPDSPAASPLPPTPATTPTAP